MDICNLICTENGSPNLGWYLFEYGGYYNKFITVVIRIFQLSFPVVQVLSKRWHDKPFTETECCHFDEIFITGCTESCHFDNFQCSQWWRFHQNDDIFVSVLVTAALKASIKNKNVLCNAYLMHPIEIIEINTITTKNILREVLTEAEIKYYETLFDEHKDSVYKMCKSLNPIINPKKGKSVTRPGHNQGGRVLH